MIQIRGLKPNPNLNEAVGCVKWNRIKKVKKKKEKKIGQSKYLYFRIFSKKKNK